MNVYQMPLRELQSLSELKQVEARLREFCRGEDRWTPIFSSSVTDGGKRLRPSLVILCGSFLPAPKAELIDVATSVELIHAASLVHDDVVDRSSNRRGNLTISARWGEQQAVLYGDFLFARSFSLLTGHGHSEILGVLTKAISLMCEGEIEQFARRYDCNVTEAEYMSYIHKKTAFFLSACCLAGAEVCGLPHVHKKMLAAFGMQLGYAFQITDDLLDYCGLPHETGKPILHDLREGYLTLPIIKLLQQPQHKGRVTEIICAKDFSEENLAYIQNTLKTSGILGEIQLKARTAIARAKQNVNKLPAKPQKVILSRLADYICQRSF